MPFGFPSEGAFSFTGIPTILPAARPGQLQSAVVTSTLTREEFDSRRQALDTECSVLDTVPGTLQEIDLDTLMKRWRNSETPMRFYKSIGEVTASRFSPSTTTTLPPLDLNQMRLLYGRAKLSGDQTKTVVTAFQSYSFAAGMEMPKTDFAAHGWLAIRQKVTNGQVGFGILDEEKNDFVVRQFLNKEDGFETVYLALDRSSAPKMLVVENGDHGGSSEVQIQDMLESKPVLKSRI